MEIREFVIQASNDTNTQEQRSMIQIEIAQRIAEIDFMARQLQYNEITLLDGSLARPSTHHTSILSAMGQIQPTWRVANLYQAQMPTTQNSQAVRPMAAPTQINIYSLTDGAGEAGVWSFNAGVLRIEGNGAFQINGGGFVTTNRIEVASGVNADIVLNNVNIDTSTGAALDMGDATVNLRLLGNNVLATSAVGAAGIRNVGAGHLTIDGDGRLYAISRVGGAGIGGGSIGLLQGETAGTTVINSGTIRAVAYGGAGIGGGSGVFSGGGGGNIYIHGGTVIAQNYRGGAGIGGGAGAGNTGGNITITGGTVTAAGGTEQPGAHLHGGAGIGGGSGGGSGGTINISGGTVNATGGNEAAGIGGGFGGGGGTVNVSGGIVNATGGNDGASIGGGQGGQGADLTISGGLVEISAGQWVGGGVGSNLNTGTTAVQGGNFSIHDPEYVHNNITHNGAPAFRVQITLQDANGTTVPFGAYTPVTYTINGTTINAITDSQGNLFMYLPEDAEGDVVMNFNGRTYRGELDMNADHGNHLILTRDYNAGVTRRPDGQTLHIQVGPNSNHSLFINIEAMDARALGLVDSLGNSIIDVTGDSGASISQQISVLDGALSYISTEWARLGAMQNRLGHISQTLTVTSENLSDAESRIRDTDMAREFGRLTRANVRHRASMAVISHANQASDRVLWLVQGRDDQHRDES